jgi:hypothetical protein
MAQLPGNRWTTTRRAGLSHREAGRAGGQRRVWAPPRSPGTQEEAAMRWHMGESTQAALAREYGVALSTMRRWCDRYEQLLKN